MAVGFLDRGGFTESAPAATGRGKQVTLTGAGHAARADCAERITRAEHEWSQRCGEALLGRVTVGLDAILDAPGLRDALAPARDGWRRKPPDDEQTQAMLADPRGNLPRHPMVLHRGGWPDGA